MTKEELIIKDYENVLVNVIKSCDFPITLACNALNKHNPELMNKLVKESQNEIGSSSKRQAMEVQ